VTDGLSVAASERGTIRVFSADLTPAELARLRTPSPTDPRPADLSVLAALLGVDTLAPGQVELFHSDDVAPIGLAAYLTEGSAVAEAAIAADRARLDALQGPLLIVHSAAFGGQAVTLHPDARLRLQGVYTAETPPVRFEPLPDASARDRSPTQGAKPPMSPARVGGMVATVALLIMFALVAVVVWVAA
jgi:hypothetical protein